MRSIYKKGCAKIRTAFRVVKTCFKKASVPKIKETHHTAEQFAVPGLFQLKVDITGAAAEDMELIKEIVRPPFVNHRLEVALADRHFGRDRCTYLSQVVAHRLLAQDEAGVNDVGAIGSRYRVGEVHCLVVLKTWR